MTKHDAQFKSPSPTKMLSNIKIALDLKRDAQSSHKCFSQHLKMQYHYYSYALYNVLFYLLICFLFIDCNLH